MWYHSWGQVTTAQELSGADVLHLIVALRLGLGRSRRGHSVLEAIRKPLGYHVGCEHYIRLGGGTALAARWRHRHSTDVDLFVDPAAYAAFFTLLRKMERPG